MQSSFERDLKLRLMKAIIENAHLYSEYVIKNFNKGLKGYDAYDGAPKTIVDKINELAKMELHIRPDLLERYNMALANPDICGYHFGDNTLTVGKIYLFFVWAFSGRVGKKKNCIGIDACFMECLHREQKKLLSKSG